MATLVEFLSRYSKVLMAVFALGLPLGSVYFHGKSEAPTAVDHYLNSLTSPALFVVDGIVGGIYNLWGNYIALVNVQAENEELIRENKRLLGESKKARRLELQNTRLKRLVGFKEAQNEFKLTPARVVARDISPHYRVVKLSLDVGENTQIRVGMPVLSHAGVVGRVSEVSEATCEVMLIVDSRSAMNVRIAGKGVTGTLRGAGVRNEYEAKFRFLHKNRPVGIGDVVVTSGHDQVFPSGLEVGRIMTGDYSQSGIYYLYTVVPTVNFSTLEEVFVLTDEREITSEEDGS